MIVKYIIPLIMVLLVISFVRSPFNPMQNFNIDNVGFPKVDLLPKLGINIPSTTRVFLIYGFVTLITLIFGNALYSKVTTPPPPKDDTAVVTMPRASMGVFGQMLLGQTI